MENKKMLSLFLMATLLFSVSGVFAQEMEDVSLVAGDTLEQDLEYAGPEQAHESMGGVISRIQSTWEKVVSFGLLKIYGETIVEDIESFDLVAFPADSLVDFDEIVVIDSYQVSDSVVINGATANVYETFNVQTTATEYNDEQSLSVFGDEMIWIDGNAITMTGPDRLQYDFVAEDSTTGSGTAPMAYSIGTEPSGITAEDIETEFGITIDSGTTVWFVITEFDATTYRVISFKISGVDNYVYDRNHDLVYDFTPDAVVVSDGYQTSSHEGNTLLLASAPSVMDLYGILPI